MKKFLALLIIFAMLVSPALVFNVAAEGDGEDGGTPEIVADGDDYDGDAEGIVPINAEIDGEEDEVEPEDVDGLGDPQVDADDGEEEPADVEEPEEEDEEEPETEQLVKPTTHTVVITGLGEVEFDAYVINGNNYVKLRDMAYMLNMANNFGFTEKCVGVEWDDEEKAVYLTTGEAYEAVGGEMEPKGEDEVLASPSEHIIYLDGELIDLKAYLIEDNNYFKLRDICQAFDIGVDFEITEDGLVVTIDLNAGYVPEGAVVEDEEDDDEDADVEDGEEGDEEDEEDSEGDDEDDDEEDEEGDEEDEGEEAAG